MLKKKCTLTATEEEIQKVVDLWCEQEGVQSHLRGGEALLPGAVHLVPAVPGHLRQAALLGKELRGHLRHRAGGRLCPAQRQRLPHRPVGVPHRRQEHRRGLCGDVGVQPALQPGERVPTCPRRAWGRTPSPIPTSPSCWCITPPPGRGLWDIAKSHRALLSDLQEQNDLYEDTLPDARPLNNLQPIKHTAVER